MTSPDDRRFAQLDARIDSLDQHGTRGMESLRSQVTGMQRDFGKLESTVDRIESTVQQIQLSLVAIKVPRNWPIIVAIISSMIPMYALVTDLIVRGFK